MKPTRVLLLVASAFALNAVRSAPPDADTLARSRLDAGDVRGAIEAANHAAMRDPLSPSAALMVAQLARGQYGPVASLPLFERALALQPDNLGTLGEMAATLGEAGQGRAMLGLTRRILALDRGSARAFFLQALLAARAGRYALARSLLYRTGGRMDGTPAVDLLHGALEIEAGNSGQAVARLKELVLRRPLHFGARRLLASAQWQGGDMAGVIETLRPMVSRADADAYSLTLAGRALEARGDRVAAADLLDRAALGVPGDAVSFSLADWAGSDPTNADVAIPRISQLAAVGDARAISIATAIREKNPGSPSAHVALGDAFLASKQTAAAAQSYRTAANLDFSESVALRLISALQRSGQSAAAAQAASLYLAQNPRSIPALRLAGNAAIARQDWARAATLLDTVQLRLGNRDVTSIIAAGWAHYRSGNGKVADALAKRAVALSPSNPRVIAAVSAISSRPEVTTQP